MRVPKPDAGAGGSRINWVTVAGDYLYYFKAGNTLHRTDGINITSITFPESATTYLECIYAAGDDLYIVRSAGDNQHKMWVYDDDAGNWVLLKSFQALSSGPNVGIHNITPVSDKMFFSFRKSTNKDSNSDELWISDGTINGTIRLREFTFKSTEIYSYADHFVAQGNLLFFKAGGSAGNSLWRSDGTVEGTIKIHDAKITRANDHDLNLPAVAGGSLWFCGSIQEDSELWNSDGTPAGTVLWANLHPTQRSFPHLITNAGALVYFVTKDSNTGIKTLWKHGISP